MLIPSLARDLKHSVLFVLLRGRVRADRAYSKINNKLDGDEDPKVDTSNTTVYYR